MRRLLKNQSIHGKKLFLFLFLILMAGCDNTGQTTSTSPVHHFRLTLALSGPLGDAGSPLPDDIKSMLNPLEATNCAGSIFIPDVTVVRLDLPTAKPEELDLGKDQNEVEKRLGKAVTVQKARSVRENALTTQKVSSLMAQPKGPENAANENIKTLLARAGSQHIFALEGTQAVIGSASNANKVIMARDTNELLSKMGERFCGKTGEQPKTSDSLIIYRTGAGSDVITGGGTPPTDSGEGKKELEKLVRTIYADGVKGDGEQTELDKLISKYGLDKGEAVRFEQKIKDQMLRSEMSLKQGMLYASQTKYSQAVGEFKHSTEMDPKNAYGWANLCGAYLNLGDLPQAQTACNQALEADPNNWFAHYNFGSFYAKSDKKEEAIRSLSEALRFVAEGRDHRITRVEVIRQMKTDPAFASLRKDNQFQQLLTSN